MAVEYQKPLVKPIKTPYGFYVYETNQNKLLSIQEPLFRLVEAVLAGDTVAIGQADPAAVAQYQELQELGYLSCHRVSHLEHPSTQLLPYYLERKIDRMTLQVTQQCNLRCSYCIYSENANFTHRSHSSKRLSLETGKRAIDFYYDHSVDCTQILLSFYGGEPLLEFRLIQELVAYAKTKFSGKDLSFALTTNATLLTDEIIDFFAQEHFYLTISMDGPKDIHDQNRRFALSDQGSFDVVYRNIEKIKSRHPEFAQTLALSMVINPDNDYQHINDLFKDTLLRTISLNASIVESDEQETVIPQSYRDQSDYQQFLALLSCLEKDSKNDVAKIAVNGLGMARDRLDRAKPSVPQNSSIPSGPCLPGKTRLFMDCDGNLFPCERVSDCSRCMKIGTLEDGFDYSKIDPLLNISQLTPEACKDCWAAPLCGVCAKKADVEGAFSSTQKLKACEGSKGYALYLLRLKALFADFRIRTGRR